MSCVATKIKKARRVKKGPQLFRPRMSKQGKRRHTLEVGVFECSESFLASDECCSAKEDEGGEEGNDEDDVDVSTVCVVASSV